MQEPGGATNTSQADVNVGDCPAIVAFRSAKAAVDRRISSRSLDEYTVRLCRNLTTER